MPSDPTGRNPVGTLARPGPDFFDDNLGVAGIIEFQVPAMPTNSWWTVALFNNANTGVAFKIYAITASSQGGGGVGLFWKYGTLGTFQQNAAPLRPDHATPFGQIYTQSITGSALTRNPLAILPFVGDIGAAGFDSGTSSFPHPILIVPAGWSLVACNLGSDQQGGVFFWYQQSNE